MNEFETYLPEEGKQKNSGRGKKITAIVLSAVILAGAVAGGAWLAGSIRPTDRDVALASSAVVTTVPVSTTVPTVPTDVTTAPGTVLPQTTEPGRATTMVNYATGEGKPMSASEIYETYVGAVVGVVTEGTTTNIFGQQSAFAASGTGFVVSSDGYIITNCHVISGGNKFTVSFADESTYEAQVVGSDAENDVALLKIDATGLKTVLIGNSDDVRVGEDLAVIGNPLGELTFSLTKGIVSALNRVITTDSDTSNYMFQLDAAINSGNSGGPVFNSMGQVIGVATAKHVDSGVEGLGFALPINDVIHIANELQQHGSVRKVSFGITVTYASYEANPGEDTTVQGSRVQAVNPGESADQAGVKVGDVITHVDGLRVTGTTDLLAAKQRYLPGEQADLTILRDGEKIHLTITFQQAAETVEESDPTPQTTQPVTPQNPFGGYDPFSGFNPFGGFNW